MISMSLAAFAQQVRHAVELHSVADLLVLLDKFTSISDNFATVGLTVPAQLLACVPAAAAAAAAAAGPVLPRPLLEPVRAA